MMQRYYLGRHCAHFVLASSGVQGGELPVAVSVFTATFSDRLPLWTNTALCPLIKSFTS